MENCCRLLSVWLCNLFLSSLPKHTDLLFCAKAQLVNGANLSAVDDDGKSAMIYAFLGNHVHIVEVSLYVQTILVLSRENPSTFSSSKIPPKIWA